MTRTDFILQYVKQLGAKGLLVQLGVTLWHSRIIWELGF